MERHIICLHIPYFGIALSQASDVSLRCRPVAIARVHTSRALVQEVSWEACGEGIARGMSVEVARRLCPGLRVIPPDTSRLRAAHSQLQNCVRPFAPVCEPIRPGSLFLDLTGTTRLFGPSIDTAARIGREVMQQQGFHSLIGLAGSKLVSQLATTTLDRSPQVFSIHPSSEQSFLAPLPAALLPGFPRAETSQVLRRLEDLNLQTLGSIAAVPLAHLESAFGASAALLHNWALGIDPSPVQPPSEQPTIERSMSLDPDEVDDQVLLGRLHGLLEVLCSTLREQRRVCRQLVLTIRHSDDYELIAQQRLQQGTYWEADLQPILTRLFFRCFRRRVRLRRVTLQVGHLAPPAQQLSLYDASSSAVQPTPHRLSLALDRIRQKFGQRAVSWGRTLQ